MQPKAMMVWLFIATLGLTNCQVTVNQSIEIEDGKKIRNDLNTINGNIVIGRECLVQGTCRTVNGSIEVGEQAEVYELQTVNGSIRIGHDVTIEGDIQSINGSIRSRRGARIDGRISSVNSNIELEGTTVLRDLVTYNGDIILADSSIVHGDILVKRGRDHSGPPRRLTIRITNHSIVQGSIVVRDEAKRVTVDLAEGGTVKGQIQGAEKIEE
jgi:predicted acyltransferase (DUF342 family)